ncbi:cytochrome P450 [Bradyrhizobium tropiciagri]|nr:cytochrome P450 [Bradyrhizobium tropiciagri]MBR0896723.1 cytochrome P450 [Bradyrhizobium tropiciagri]
MADADFVGQAPPISSVDPFSTDSLTDPYPMHEALREAGATVWLEMYGVVAMARHAEVYAALSDWRTYCSGRGVGIDDFAVSKPWRAKSLLLEVDPPIHDVTRGVMSRVLSPGAIRSMRDEFERKAERLADELLDRREFDAIPRLAEAYPLEVFPDAVGLQKEGRHHLLPFGNMIFNSFVPNERFRESVRDAAPVVEWIFGQCARERLMPGGFGSQIWSAVDSGSITSEEAQVLVRAFLQAGLDTTVTGIGNAVYAFAKFPVQWETLRSDTKLLRPSFDEVLRWESPVQTFFRTTTCDVEVGGRMIPEGRKVLLFLGAANRDRRRFDNPATFDIRRRATGHVAFGTGIHGCVGQILARVETEAMLGALLRRVKRIELIGEPKRKLNNTVRSLAALPVRLHPV